MNLTKRKVLITCILVVILAGGAVGSVLTLGSAAAQPAANPTALPPATAQVTRTTLVETRTFDGTLGYVDPVPVSATGTGTLTWMAPVGSTVERGEPLFKVDGQPVVALYGSEPLYRTLHPGMERASTDPTPLQQRVEEAEAALRLAKLQLENLEQGPRPEEIAAAEAALRSAEARLQDVSTGASAQDVIQAQAAVSSAAASLRAAESQLEQRRAGPNEADLAAAEQAVVSAQGALQRAETDLAKIEAGATVEEFFQAEMALEQAKNTLWSQQISRDATCGRFGPDSTECKSGDAAVAASETSVTRALASLEALRANPDPRDVEAAQATVASARESLRAAQAKLDQVRRGATDQDLLQAQASVDSARANYQSAVAKLEQLQVGAKASEVESALSAVLSAKSQLVLITAPSSELEVARAREQVRQSEIARREALMDLENGVQGADVRQLEENLAKLGYTGFTVDGIYDSATAEAVRAWQADLGLPQTGIVEPGRVVFTPGPVRIAEHTARVGSGVGGGGGSVLSYTDTVRVVTVPLRVTDQALAVVGRAVTVTVPGASAVEGEISRVGTVVTEQQIDVTVTIASQDALGSLDVAPVEVAFVSQEREDVLTVPVAALLALAEGGYGVEVVDGATTRIVPVRLGMFAAGRVEVSGEGIAEGMSVGVAR
jgi:peptidoglycan hydrolase-like protein with peptidoglycan-binding domain/multidrug resistance efflux pump